MLQNLGQQIRELRTQKGITLNEFAKQLNISSGYLSNLETGKTDNIPLLLLEKIDQELNLLPKSFHSGDKMSLRLNRIEQQLNELNQTQPEIVEYLIKTLEDGINWFNK